jgi:hypothetical protein
VTFRSPVYAYIRSKEEISVTPNPAQLTGVFVENLRKFPSVVIEFVVCGRGGRGVVVVVCGGGVGLARGGGGELGDSPGE